MTWLWNFVSSSIGKKSLMALSGLFFCGFLLVHMGGNMLLFVGADAFNAYTTIMSTALINKVLEVLMVVLFLVHIYTSAVLTLENRAARPQKYAMDVSAGKRTFMSSNMFVTGSIVSVFVVLHLIGFKYGEWSNDAAAMTDPNNLTMYALVADRFKGAFYALAYTIAVIVLGFHLNHAFQSAFQTLGLNHKKYTPFITKLGTLYSIVIALGFASSPVYFFISQLSAGG
ncbi:MAG: succinate dehydrogenase cytochrome b subunit [Proteobacteria bacterium]|nr:succinate dehydrogenase cytochrome b subunit [Pseudomonadota bacterium]